MLDIKSFLIQNRAQVTTEMYHLFFPHHFHKLTTNTRSNYRAFHKFKLFCNCQKNSLKESFNKFSKFTNIERRKIPPFNNAKSSCREFCYNCTDVQAYKFICHIKQAKKRR